MTLSWGRFSVTLLGEVQCHSPGGGSVSLSWGRFSVTLLGEVQCHYPGGGSVTLSWRRFSNIILVEVELMLSLSDGYGWMKYMLIIYAT